MNIMYVMYTSYVNDKSLSLKKKKKKVKAGIPYRSSG